MATPMSPKELEDAFIKVTFEDDTLLHHGTAATDPLYDPWIDQGAYSSTLRRVRLPIVARSVQQVQRARRVWVGLSLYSLNLGRPSMNTHMWRQGTTAPQALP